MSLCVAGDHYPRLRELTAALAAARVPVLTGGHTLLNGGMMVLADQAWLENDRRR